MNKTQDNQVKNKPKNEADNEALRIQNAEDMKLLNQVKNDYKKLLKDEKVADWFRKTTNILDENKKQWRIKQ